jgi:hypothetical protein
MKNLIGKKVFVLEKDVSYMFTMRASNWENFADIKFVNKHGPFEVLDCNMNQVLIQDGLRFRLISITDIELATPLTEAIQE